MASGVEETSAGELETFCSAVCGVSEVWVGEASTVGFDEDSWVVPVLQALQNKRAAPPVTTRFQKLIELGYGMASCRSQNMGLAGKLRHNESSHCCDVPKPARQTLPLAATCCAVAFVSGLGSMRYCIANL